MYTIEVSDDLALEVHLSSSGDHALLLRSLALEADGEADAGMVVIWPAEIRPLIGALGEAAGLVAEEAAHAIERR
jgi:hypothetical protein